MPVPWHVVLSHPASIMPVMHTNRMLMVLPFSIVRNLSIFKNGQRKLPKIKDSDTV